MAWWMWVSMPHATFGLDVSDDLVVTAAPPIARWTLGRPAGTVKDYFRSRGADVRVFPQGCSSAES